MYTVAPRAIPVRDTWDVGDLDDIACSAKNAVRE
jgi:hypothetical protein